MGNFKHGLLVTFTVFVWLFGAAALTGAVTGCASNAPDATTTPDVFTDSDEPESRKRATNRLRLAVLYFSDGKTTIALDEVKQAIAADPNWFESYNMRGLIYRRLGDTALADASFQKALSLNPGSADVKHNYGVFLCDQRRGPEAFRMFGAALETVGYGRRANTWAAQGACQLSLGQRSDAEASFLKSYELDASNPVTGYNLALLLYQREDFVRSLFYIRRINNSDLANAESLWLGIKVERRLDNREAMAQLAVQLRKRFPQSPEVSALDRGAFNE
ncbi:MAG: type IV pilus biogenesis/stability protein PilW [Burkholderiales bacterium]|nr:type IV pilus biogenesis/stability protein PilW [Burkholderiales bacterium]